jgi:hypothetical protein
MMNADENEILKNCPENYLENGIMIRIFYITKTTD